MSNIEVKTSKASTGKYSEEKCMKGYSDMHGAKATYFYMYQENIIYRRSK
jgi:hypothetical protein